MVLYPFKNAGVPPNSLFPKRNQGVPNMTKPTQCHDKPDIFPNISDKILALTIGSGLY
jgi:hypothetical protein